MILPSSYSVARDVWLNRSQHIANWQIRRMVNRTDQATYWTRKGWKAIPGDVAGKLRANCGMMAPTVCYAFNSAGLCKWVCLDYDNHSSDPAVAVRNLMIAVAILNTLTAMGIICILEDSDGQGGLHLWILFDPAVPIDSAYRFARFIRSDYPCDDIETNPKQRRVKDSKGELRWGNGVRLPGHHHRREHISRFWGDSAWLDDPEESIGLMLCTPTNSPDVLDVMGDYDPDHKPVVQPVVPKPHFATYSGNGGIVTEAEQAVEQMSWSDLLTQFGWHGDGEFWTRPGKDFGISARLDYNGNGALYVFSVNAGLPVEKYRKPDKPGASFGKWRFWLYQTGFDENRQREAAEYFFRGVVR